ncbi:MAG: nuclear transport factor 2 family protein [Isosphaeraceae bacterium]|nr:nuclear transport factor 2 family protein [Isosphaeraceae bacterium]
MTPRLPYPLEDYFKDANARDVATMLSRFTNDSIVVDEGRRHRGLVEIHEWMRQTIEEYAFQVDPIESSQRGSDTLVTTSVSGRFPGSPITLQYAFRVENRKITALEIG